MSEPSMGPEDNDQLLFGYVVDRACDQFESALKKGEGAKIEDFLIGVVAEQRGVLLRELLIIDVSYRRRRGEKPEAQDYFQRFSAEAELVRNVFRELEANAASTHSLQESAAAGDFIGSAVGPYKLLSVLGEGGFGTVFLADQAEPIRRRVALKIIKAGMDTRQVLARFEAERQVLAMMDHPNIAKVYDAGSTPSGRSYFVMELVHGEPITDYCDRQKLTLEERLELFIPVCQAVQHAHQKGIIHRDIKPKNVLVSVVDDRPMPKVIDFGIAKATAQPLTQQTIFTEQGQLIGTPEYMSPEQAEMSNIDIDTRSDIYSLGVLLYELLTGVLPFDRRTLRRAGFEEIRRIIREVEPPKPSTKISTLGADSRNHAMNRRTDLQSLRRRLRQELDWIVMKTLEKDRRRRYATAIGLAEDIQHYLRHEPVQAGPPGSWYRMRRYARRYRMPLGIAAGFVALLVVITVLAVGGYYRQAALRAETETARGQAEMEAERAKQNFSMARDAVKKYYTQVAADPRLKPHNLETLRRDLLQSANEFYEKLIRQETENPDLQLARVEAFIERGKIEEALGNRSAGETAYHNAITAATQLLQAYGAEPEYQKSLAAGHNNLALLYQATGRFTEAEAAHKQALAIRKILAEKHPDVPDYQYSLASSHNNLGGLYQDKGQAKEAEAAHKAALAIRKILVEKHPEVPEYQNELGHSHHNLGDLYQDTGRAKQAEAAYKQAIVIRKTVAEKHPNVPEYQHYLALSHNNLGNLCWVTGRVKEAEAAWNEAFRIRKTLAEEHPEVTEYQDRLAGSYNNLGILYQTTGRAKEAEADYQEAIVIRKSLAKKHPEVPKYQDDVAASDNNLGLLYKDTDRAKQAEAANREAIVIRKSLVEKHPEVPEYQNRLAADQQNLGDLYSDTGRPKEAEAAYREALAIWKTLVERHPEVPEYRDSLAKSHNNLGTLYSDTGRAKEAEAACKEAIAIRKPLVERHPEVPDYQDNLAASHNNLGNLYRDTGRAREAEAACKEAIAIRKPLAEKHPEVPAYQNHLAGGQYALGLVYSDAGRLKEAEAAYEEAHAIWKALVKIYPQVPEYQESLEVCERDYKLAHLYHARRVARQAAKASWSPDGKRLVYARQPFGSGLQVCELATAKITDVVAAGKDPAWSPGDGRWIAYVRGSSAADEEVWLVTSDGQNARKIAEGGYPSWSSDGKTLFFHSRKQRKLLAIQPDGKDARPTEICEMPDLHPSLSPDGTRICYTRGDRLFLEDRATKKNVLEIPLPAKGEFLHSWSPSGRQVGLGAIPKQPGSACGLWILDVETKKFRKAFSGRFTMPAWSPDGSRIAVELRGDGASSEIWTIETKNLENAR